MAKFHIGLKETCPLDNVVISGLNIPKVSGAPGHAQERGSVLEISEGQLARMKKHIAKLEVRRFKKRGASCVKVGENRDKEGEICRGPAVASSQPLSEFVYIREYAEPAPAPTPDPDPEPAPAPTPDPDPEPGDDPVVDGVEGTNPEPDETSADEPASENEPTSEE